MNFFSSLAEGLNSLPSNVIKRLREKRKVWLHLRAGPLQLLPQPYYVKTKRNSSVSAKTKPCQMPKIFKMSFKGNRNCLDLAEFRRSLRDVSKHGEWTNIGEMRSTKYNI